MPVTLLNWDGFPTRSSRRASPLRRRPSRRPPKWQEGPPAEGIRYSRHGRETPLRIGARPRRPGRAAALMQSVKAVHRVARESSVAGLSAHPVALTPLTHRVQTLFTVDD